MKAPCKHPKLRRELLGGYDVLCGECGEVIGRVALFPSAVLTARQAADVLARMDRSPVTSDERDGRTALLRARNQAGLV